MAHLDFDIEQHYTVGERQFILYEYFQKYTGKGQHFPENKLLLDIG